MPPPPPPPDRHPSSRGGKKKSSSSSRRNNHHDKQRSQDTHSSGSEQHHAGEGVTVAEFRHQQQQKQDRASSRQGKARRHPPNHMQQQRLLQGENDVGSSYTESTPESIAKQQQQQVVDTIAADHPSSNIIQTLRACTLCHRTLPRAQFSERDRYTIHESLATGAVCRTCSMTISAVRLKGIPNTEQLLMAYAERGEQMASMIAGGAFAGYLDNGSLSSHQNPNGEEAMVLRQNSNSESIEMMYKGHPVGSVASPSSNRTISSTMGMPSQTLPDVNSAFSGQQYGGGEEDRPANVADCKYIDALLRMPSYLNLNAYGIFQSSEEVSISMATLEAVRLYGTLDETFFVPHDTEGLPSKSRKANLRSMLPTEQDDVENEAVNPKSIVCLVLGEGRTPRTAVLCSVHYGWTSYSIDPSLSDGWDGYHEDIPAFTGYSGTVAEFVDNTQDSIIEIQNQSVKHLVIICINKQKDQIRLKGDSNIMEIRARYNDVPTTLVSISPVRKATLAPKRRSGQYMSKLEKDIGYDPNCSYIDSSVFSECRLLELWNFHNADDEEGSGSDYDSYVDENIKHGEIQGQHSQGDEYRDMERNKLLDAPQRTREVHSKQPPNRHNREYNNGEMDHSIDNNGIDDHADDIWGKALAKHNEEEQEKLVDQFETLYMDNTPPVQMEELERTKSDVAKEQSQEQTAIHDFPSRQDQYCSDEEEEEEAHEDLIAWSDDKLDWSDDMITDLPKVNSESPKKLQPWHKKDVHDDSSNSFASYD